jgi:hypothetical protein
MKTTVEISDALFARAQKKARREGRSLRSLIEEGLRRCLDEDRDAGRPSYRLPDHSVGDAKRPNPLASMSWAEIRDEIYGGR